MSDLASCTVSPHHWQQCFLEPFARQSGWALTGPRSWCCLLWPLLAWCLSPLQAGVPEDLREANAKFTCEGRPIHPGMVKQFEGWMSDSGRPITVSVDVAAGADTNQYRDREVTVESNGTVLFHQERGYFSYRRLGKINGDIQVLEVSSSGGGSGVFRSLCFVQFHVAQGWYDGDRYDRLMMTVVGWQNLGDRDDGRITVHSDRVVVGESKYRKKPLLIKLGSTAQPKAATARQRK